MDVVATLARILIQNTDVGAESLLQPECEGCPRFVSAFRVLDAASLRLEAAVVRPVTSVARYVSTNAVCLPWPHLDGTVTL